MLAAFGDFVEDGRLGFCWVPAAEASSVGSLEAIPWHPLPLTSLNLWRDGTWWGQNLGAKKCYTWHLNKCSCHVPFFSGRDFVASSTFLPCKSSRIHIAPSPRNRATFQHVDRRPASFPVPPLYTPSSCPSHWRLVILLASARW